MWCHGPKQKPSSRSLSWSWLAISCLLASHPLIPLLTSTVLLMQATKSRLTNEPTKDEPRDKVRKLHFVRNDSYAFGIVYYTYYEFSLCGKERETEREPAVHTSTPRS